MVDARTSDLKICGLAAVRAQFQQDASAIKRLYFDRETGRRIGVICKALAAARKVYRCVEPPELEKIAGSVHHGGVVAVVEPPALRVPREDEVARWAERHEPLLVLDRVGNAHNVGAIVRTMAFFGVPRIVVADHPQQALPSDAAYRVAEGGMAHVEIFRVADLARFCRVLAGSYDVVGTAVGVGVARLGRKRTGPAPQNAKPVAIVLGNEEHGLAPDVAAACSRLVTIPGSGKVESLNVSVATAVLLWELWARYR